MVNSTYTFPIICCKTCTYWDSQHILVGPIYEYAKYKFATCTAPVPDAVNSRKKNIMPEISGQTCPVYRKVSDTPPGGYVRFIVPNVGDMPQ